MRLILSSHHPRNSTYSTESGKVIYKVDKPHKFFSHSVATIRKAVPTIGGISQGEHLHPWPRDKSPFSDDGKDETALDATRRSIDSQDRPFIHSGSEDEARSSRDLPTFEGHFAFYAQVEFHTFESARFQYDGLDVSVKDYFRKEGWSWYGRGRIFTASDGREYRWELRAKHLEMITNDDKKTSVVQFREGRPDLGSLMKGRPAYLDVDPSCEPILDEIMMTFIYCHKLRKDRERSQRNAAH